MVIFFSSHYKREIVISIHIVPLILPRDLIYFHPIFLNVMLLHPSMDMSTCVYAMRSPSISLDIIFFLSKVSWFVIHPWIWAHVFTPCEALWSHLISSFFSKCHDSSSIHGYGHMCLRRVKPLDLTWYHLIFLSVMILHPSMDMGTGVYVRWSLWRRAGLTQCGTRLNSCLTWVLYFHTTLFLRLYLTC